MQSAVCSQFQLSLSLPAISTGMISLYQQRLENFLVSEKVRGQSWKMANLLAAEGLQKKVNSQILLHQKLPDRIMIFAVKILKIQVYTKNV